MGKRKKNSQESPKNIKKKGLSIEGSEVSSQNREDNSELMEIDDNGRKGNNLLICESEVISNESKKSQAQEWLDKEYPKNEVCQGNSDEKNKGKKREKIKELNISDKNLEGFLNLEGFTNLQKLNCSKNQLTELDLSDCSKLIEIDCWDNQLTKLKFISLSRLTILNAWNNNFTGLSWEKIGTELTTLSLSNNIFSPHNLECFSKFIGLEELYLGTDKKERVNEKLYNRFNGSLKPLESLKKLEKLQIEVTDIADDLEYLPESLERIVHWGLYHHEENFGVKKIEEILEDYKEGEDQNYYNYKKWKGDRKKWIDKWFKDKELKKLEEIGVKMNDSDFADYLKKNSLTDKHITEYEIEQNDAQKWVDYFYPLKTRETIEELNISNNKITGSLELKDFKNLKKIVIKCGELKDLKLINLTKLEKFRANPCQLAELTIKNCPNIIDLNVANNLLTHLDFLNALKNKLKNLSIHSNDLPMQGLDFLSKFENLEQLYIDNCDKEKFRDDKYNRFNGSLKPLKALKNLQYLSISNTDIDSGLEHLSKTVRRIGCISKWKRGEGSEKDEKGIGFFRVRRKLEKLEKFLDDKWRKEIADKERKDKTPGYIIAGYHIFSPCEKKNSVKENSNLLTSSPALYEEWEIRGFTRRGIKKWIEKAKFSPYEAPYVKEWEERSFTYKEVKEWRAKGLESDDYEFACYLKKEHKDLESLNYHNLYTLWKKYEKEQVIKSSQVVRTIAEIPPSLDKIDKSTNNGEVGDEVDYKTIYPEEIPGENFAWEARDESIDLPTKLYNVKKYQANEKKVDDIIDSSVEKIKLDSNIKNYAILSYVCGPYACEIDTHKNCRKCSGYIYQGLKGSLKKATEALKFINEKKCIEFKKAIGEIKVVKEEKIEEKIKNFGTIDYLWVDQFCIDQSNPHEKAEEIRKMHQYYSNAEVTLIPIDSNAKSEAEKFNDSVVKLCDFFKGKYREGKKISINKDINEKIEGLTRNLVKESLDILKKIINSEWFRRSWTFQEGWLSKRTLFMFNDCLVDGRFLALMWKFGHEFVIDDNEEQKSIETFWKNAIFWEGEEKQEYEKLENFWEEKFSNTKAATPIGWVYYKGGYNQRDVVYLGLNEALKEMKNRDRSIAIDGIYSFLSLLPYGQKVEIEYSKNPNHQYNKNELRKALTDVMKAAINAGYAEPLTWHGSSSREPGLCWTPHIDGNGSTSIEDYIKVHCVPERIKFKPEGMEVIGSEYVIGYVEDESPQRCDNNSFYKLKVRIELGELEDKPVNLVGTKGLLKAIDKGNSLVVFSKGEWKSEKPFALLVTRGDDNIRHRVGLVEFSQEEEKKIESRVAKRKKLIIGLNKFNGQEKAIVSYLGDKITSLEGDRNQQYQVQIPPK